MSKYIMHRSPLTHPSLLLLFLLFASTYSRKTECFVDSKGSLGPNNIYKCKLEEKCCREEGKPSCCKTKETSEAAMEQVKLWGILLTFILILALLMWFCRHDGDCCCNAKDGRMSCCGKPCGKKPQDNYVENTNSDSEEETENNNDGDNPKKKDPPKSAATFAPASAKVPPSPTSNLPPPADVPPSYSDLELNEIP